MIKDYVAINRIIGRLLLKYGDAYFADINDDTNDLRLISKYIVDELKEVKRLWPQNLQIQDLDHMISHILEVESDWSPPTFHNLIDFLGETLVLLNDHILNSLQAGSEDDLVNILHPVVLKSS